MRTKTILLPAIALLSSATYSQDHFVSRAIQRYPASGWDSAPIKEGLAVDWQPRLPEYVLSQSRITTNQEETAKFTSFDLIWDVAPDNAILKLDLTRFHDVRSARHELLSRLGGMQSTMPMPQGTNGLERLGDLCFADLGSPANIMFVRNNVFVSCYSTLGSLTLTNLLFTLDAQITQSLVTNAPDSMKEQ